MTRFREALGGDFLKTDGTPAFLMFDPNLSRARAEIADLHDPEGTERNAAMPTGRAEA